MNTYTRDTARLIRRTIIDMSFNSQVGHIPSALSMCDYLGVLMENGIVPPKFRYILGKPYGSQAYYSLFAYFNLIDNDLSKFGSLDKEWRYIIQREHPLITYIDETMGNCLSVACGIALSGRKVFVNISDAAFQEGTIWESVLFAGAKKLCNLVMAIDNNNMQALGSIADILDISDLEDKLREFGWNVCSINGHDLDLLHSKIPLMLKNCEIGPIAFVMNTVKGRGVDFMENNIEWHYKSLDKCSYLEAKQILK